MKRILLTLTVLALLAPTAASAEWDRSLAAYMQMAETSRVMLISGYLGMFEAYNGLPLEDRPEVRYSCESVTHAAVRETIEQWYRMGKLDPTTKTSVAVSAALIGLCQAITVQPPAPRAVKPQM